MNRDFIIDPRKLKLATARACLSFRRLARTADLAPETVTRIYRSDDGKRVSAATVGKLAKALDVDVLDLIVDDGQ